MKMEIIPNTTTHNIICIGPIYTSVKSELNNSRKSGKISRPKVTFKKRTAELIVILRELIAKYTWRNYTTKHSSRKME